LQYIFLLYRDERWREALGEEEVAEVQREYIELHRELIERGVFVAGAPLRPTETATTVRVRDEEKVVTDGPFAETKEQLGGFILIEADSIEEARDWAARVPAARHGAIEVRAVMPAPGEAAVG
jgi:hypothetical protein